MCLILLAWQQHPDYPLVLAANRDEYYARPAAPAGPWPGQPEIVGGRDLLQGGSWLALHRNGRFAVVTNYRETPPAVEPPRSRGRLVRDFVQGTQGPAVYLAQVEGQGHLYRGFSLMVGDGRTLGYLSNRSAGHRLLPPGLYGVSNALLETPWPKVLEGKRRLAALLGTSPLDSERLFALLADATPPPIPAGADFNSDAIAGPLAPIFIQTAEYGTRCSTLLWLDRAGRWSLRERSFVPGRSGWREVDYQFAGS